MSAIIQCVLDLDHVSDNCVLDVDHVSDNYVS
jgi:hypothetical protein